MTESKICTCPSGDGSLRWPCPAHPAVEQAVGDERAAFKTAYLAEFDCDADGDDNMAHSNTAWRAWKMARAVLAQPSPAQAEAERPEVVGYLATAEHPKHGQPHKAFNYFKDQHDAQVAHWRERGCTVTEDRLMTVSQHERIVGTLRAKIAQLRQHKNDYMDAGQEKYRALQNEIKERVAEIARLDGLVSGRTAERDAALARVAELEAKLGKLEKQEPVAVVKGDGSLGAGFPSGTKLYAAPVARAQHSVPKEFIGRLSEFLAQRGATGKALLRELRALLAAAPSPSNSVPQAWLDVQAERRRQITAEGWTPEHDDLYCAAELPRAAAAYILNGANDEAPAIWPFVAKWWKPRDARSNYVRAGALILAEIERLDRAAPGKEVGHE